MDIVDGNNLIFEKGSWRGKHDEITGILVNDDLFSGMTLSPEVLRVVRVANAGFKGTGIPSLLYSYIQKGEVVEKMWKVLFDINAGYKKLEKELDNRLSFISRVSASFLNTTYITESKIYMDSDKDYKISLRTDEELENAVMNVTNSDISLHPKYFTAILMELKNRGYTISN